ncbi:hypothetical protein LOZ66_001647 [Ophidiomyces ophidiicola]|nr:hypothetical protein LOZ65_001989 [Ophidiomyces ophidiicola]KAI1941139.1 hypothetical protein LOZ66_001647 [Ophidiomyces ophidiicola]
MSSANKLRRVLITGTMAAAVASGALYGASLKMTQDAKQRSSVVYLLMPIFDSEFKQNIQKRQALSEQEKIDALLGVRAGLMQKKETLEQQIRDIEERQSRKGSRGGDNLS